VSFLSENDIFLSREYIESGYLVRSVADIGAYNRIREAVSSTTAQILGLTNNVDPNVLLDLIHNYVNPKELNAFRLEIINSLKQNPNIRNDYFQVAKPFLEALVGNELAMQRQLNLSIQLPGDDSSLLALHADTWSGDSAYEVVVWLPLVDCFRTKAMYILPPEHAREFELKSNTDLGSPGVNSESLFELIKDKVIWIEINREQVLIFDQTLPHGNRVNDETETRWSLNCRFKSVFTPYGDKKIGEFFQPITLRAASRRGMDYSLPEI
jgi:sporadic carbohydrate cluster 2OG-Fe(II) oxygenase